MYKVFYLLCCLSLAITLYDSGQQQSHVSSDQKFPGWPQQFMGQSITEVPLTSKEKKWFSSFPGKAARFQTYQTDLFIRWIERPTRRLHPVKDCLKATGYLVTPAPLQKDRQGKLWGCVHAEKHGSTYRVCEQIGDSEGQHFSDVSSWFWQSALGYSTGPWWSTAYMEKIS